MKVKPKLHAFLFSWCQEASLSTERGGPVLTTKPFHGRIPTILSKNPTPPQGGNLPFCECQETCFPKVQKGPVLPTIPNHGRVSPSPLKSKNAKFPTEGRRAITYYSVNGIKRLAS
jgi:hypothetical protein